MKKNKITLQGLKVKSFITSLGMQSESIQSGKRKGFGPMLIPTIDGQKATVLDCSENDPGQTQGTGNTCHTGW